MKKTVMWFVGLVLLLSASQVQAAQTTANANVFFPSIDDTPYIRTYGSQTMQPWQFRTGGVFNYARTPVKFTSGTGNLKVIPSLLMGDFFGTVGFTDWFQAGLDIPVAILERQQNLLTGQTQSFTRLSDIRLETKFRLLDIERYHAGISILPYIFFPTGSGDHFLGNKSFSGGGKVIFDYNIKQRAQLSLNLGYYAREKATVITSTTQISNSFTYDFGVNIKATDWMDVIGEVNGFTYTNNFFANKQSVSAEAGGALRFRPVQGMQVDVGGYGSILPVSSAYGTPVYRAMLGLSYTKPRIVDLPAPPPPVEPDNLAELRNREIVITRKVHFAFGKATIRPVSFPILDAVLDIFQNNPQIEKVRIEGHTDSIGSDAVNLKISQARANAVKAYLVSKGISADRLVAVGYGKRNPIASNDTALGRARNRRVAFEIIPTGNKL